MEPIVLKNKTPEGETLEATYLPQQGLSLVSYQKNGVEVMDQATRQDFEERSEGVGVMIGPHFHRRKPETIPPLEDESLFPHIAKVKEHGGTDPFSHGVGRYAPWEVEVTETSVKGTLSGADTWHGVPLSSIEGQNFKMTYNAELTPEGLAIEMSVVSDRDSVVGIHYFYQLPNGKGRIVSQIQDHYIANNETQSIPSDWDFDDQNTLIYPLDRDTDFTFHPFPNPREGKIVLETDEFNLETTYRCASQENAWQVWHPKGASFVCIEPISAQDPRHPNLTVSSISINLKIV